MTAGEHFRITASALGGCPGTGLDRSRHSVAGWSVDHRRLVGSAGNGSPSGAPLRAGVGTDWASTGGGESRRCRCGRQSLCPLRWALRFHSGDFCWRRRCWQWCMRIGRGGRVTCEIPDFSNYVLSSSSHSWPHELHVQIFAWTETGSLSHDPVVRGLLSSRQVTSAE
jgi:hypothetical protein